MRAVKVKNVMCRPMYSSPPILLMKSGSSGSTMLKEPKNRKELMDSSQKLREYFFIAF